MTNKSEMKTIQSNIQQITLLQMQIKVSCTIIAARHPTNMFRFAGFSAHFERE